MLAVQWALLRDYASGIYADETHIGEWNYGGRDKEMDFSLPLSARAQGVNCFYI